MTIFSNSSRTSGKLTVLVDFLERAREQMLAVAGDLVQPRAVLVPIRVVAEKRKKLRPYD